MKKPPCTNMNHGRMNVSIRYCPSCGEILNRQVQMTCTESLHAARRKERDLFCISCGKSLQPREGTPR